MSARTLAVATLFALACTQAPLYYSNQNQYLLHGLAAAGRGDLADDWLARTASPTPAFDALVTLTTRHASVSVLHAYHAALQALYCVSLLGLFDTLAGDRGTPRRRLAFAALLVLAHSGLARWASYRLLGWDYPCYLQGWLAAQYVLGPVLQPSAFGVFLLTAIDQFLRGRATLAVACVALATTLHATYLLPGGLLVLGFLAALARDREYRRAGRLAACTLALVAPGLVHAVVTFRPTSPEAFAEAQRVLAHVRIPHHCLPGLWFDAITGLQVAWVLAAVALLRGTRLFAPLAVLTGGSLLLSVAQVVSGSDALALLFPWRASVILLPVATSVILTRLVLAGGVALDSRGTGRVSIGVIVGVALAGVGLMAARQGYATNDEELPLLDFVRATHQPGDVYLLPVTVPKLASAPRGSLSSDFKPLASPTDAAKATGRLIPLDFQRFRLLTGAAVFIDFKAIPYKDADVLEWHRRVLWNQSLYRDRDWDAAGSLAEVRREGVTHVVVARDRDIRSRGLETVFEDANYRLYRVRRSP